MRPLDKIRFRAYTYIEGAVLIKFAGIVKVETKMAFKYRQDFEEWQMATKDNPAIKLGYNEYKKLLALIGECATILDHSVAETPMIEDNDLLLVPLSDPNSTQRFDCKNQLSNQAFEELEESLGLGN